MRRTLLALAALLTAAAPAVAQQTVIPDGGVRVAPGPSGDLCREVRLADEAGFPWVSVGTSWEALEPQQGQYVAPSVEQALLQCAKDRGLRTQLIVTNAPAWASGRSAGNDPPTVANVPAYGAFLSQLADSLAPLVDAWTPWNEPSFDLFWSPRDVPRYVALQKAVYPVLKAKDPTALVTAGATVGTPNNSGTQAYSFITQAYQAGLKGSADVILWNFYPRYAPETAVTDSQGRPAAWALASAPYVRNLVDQYDPGRPIWIAETSYATCGVCGNANVPPVSGALQADYIARMYTYRRRYLQADLDRIFWYQLRDSGSDANDWFANQGIFRNDWTAKQAVAALASVRVAVDPGTGGTGGNGGGTGGGGGTTVPVPTLPSGAARPPAPASATTPGGVRLALTRPKVTARSGRITLTVRATVSRGRAVMRVEGFRLRRWRLVKVVTLPAGARVTLRFPDRGYLGLRVLLRPSGSTRWAVSRVVRIPTGRATSSR